MKRLLLILECKKENNAHLKSEMIVSYFILNSFYFSSQIVMTG